MKEIQKKIYAAFCAAILVSGIAGGMPVGKPMTVHAASDSDLVLHYSTSSGNNDSGIADFGTYMDNYVD